MQKRLVWNFEITLGSFSFPEKFSETKTDFHWEARFFWPETEVISLNELDESYLKLSEYEFKKRKDLYFLLPNFDGNLKLRRDQLLYKPLIDKKNGILAYGSKVKLHELDEDALLVRNEKFKVKEIISLTQKAAPLEVSKEALIHTFSQKPKVKMELSRIVVNKKIFYSVSFESRCFEYVECLQEKLLNKAVASDYVTFLKRNFK
ncbi:Uncharacterised protein (plasmid) [Legionella adelaidensis]|uniref:Uncharacterized protein n=1 Tax=Legionella adelaidensis TaxID=45056 RepID=A0A0W0R1C8_9GAMM|nr:hypothetical protein [Legionella adelaidensis]KTC64892.1 hypothetical protein Lade_2186 [Legionella adelaidensis]VEH82937.1 Uncharacterised protein [Legionella adelaidensis]